MAESMSIHDNDVLKYSVDFAGRELVLNTRDGEGRSVDIVFRGVAAYFLENTVMGCVLLDIEEWEIDDLISYLGEDYFLEHQEYGWPLEFADMDELKAKVAENGIKTYCLTSSYGMSGFILANSVQYSLK